jgi:RNA polymerase sigma factor (sigma-70 family)
MRDDSTLLHDYAVSGSQAAFAELVRRHVDLVYGAAFRRTNGDAALTEEIVQQVFAALAQEAAALRSHTLLTGWLYVTTRHAAATALRAENRRRAREHQAHLMHTSVSSEPAADWSRLRPHLDRVIDELGERDRDAVLLRFVEGRPFAEIGRALQLSEDAARMRVDRALDKLRVLLARRGVTSTAAALSLLLTSHAAMAAPVGMAAAVSGTALATAAATGPGSSVALLSLMKTSQLAVAGALALLVAGGGAVHEARAGRQAEAALADARRDGATDTANLASLRTRTDVAEKSAAAAQAALDAARAAIAKPAPARTAALETADAGPFLERHPEVERALVGQRRARSAGTYAPLWRDLGLTPEQIERFLDLTLRGIPETIQLPSGQTLRYRLPGDRTEAMAQLQILLGDDGFARFRAYITDEASSAQLALQVAGSLYDTVAPLTAEQGRELRRILKDGRAPVEWSSRPQYDWPAISARAAQVLSPVQMAALFSYQAADEFQQAISQLGRRQAQPSSAPRK